MSTQKVAGALPLVILRDSQSEFPNNKARVCEEIPNSSKVLRESLLGCRGRKFTKIYFCHWLLCYWLIKCIPSNSNSELWNHLDFFHELSFVWCGTSMSYPPYLLMGPTWCRVWVLTHRNSKCILSFGVECITKSAYKLSLFVRIMDSYPMGSDLWKNTHPDWSNKVVPKGVSAHGLYVEASM